MIFKVSHSQNKSKRQKKRGPSIIWAILVSSLSGDVLCHSLEILFIVDKERKE
jgi:hypothetical protein